MREVQAEDEASSATRIPLLRVQPREDDARLRAIPKRGEAMTEAQPTTYDVDVDSKIIDIDPPDDERLHEALASASAELVRAKPPRFAVRVKASSEAEAEKKAVEALERWASGPGAGWSVVGVTRWKP
jgi:hypothetical protein